MSKMDRDSNYTYYNRLNAFVERDVGLGKELVIHECTYIYMMLNLHEVQAIKHKSTQLEGCRLVPSGALRLLRYTALLVSQAQLC